jgi:hypothetical protein
MKLVQSHPSFLQDPLAAMKAHLEQVVALKEAANASRPQPQPRMKK